MVYNKSDKKANGKDFNFFREVEITSDTFSDTADMVIPFTTAGVMFLNLESTGAVEVSFNGVAVHGKFDADNPSKGIIYDNRIISTIWFRLASGTTGPITMRVEAWSIP